MQLQETYQKDIRPALQKKMGKKNMLAVPRITKIVVNVGLGEALKDKKVIDAMSEQLALITGQKPKVTRARRAIATYKLRAGMPIGLKVTLRGKRMYQFLERLIAVVLPRVRDFRGIRKTAFDRRGNLNIGLQELTVFPEVNYQSLDRARGLEVTIVTTAETDDEGYALMDKIGIPFTKEI